MKKSAGVVLVLFTFVMSLHLDAYAGDSFGSRSRSGLDDHQLLVVNRPVNLQGLTGLIFTNSAYTQPAGSGAVGLSGWFENSDVPDYTAFTAAATVTLGITDRLEAGIKARLSGVSFGTGTSDYGTGDADLMVKWRFASQGDILPAMAFGLAWTFPTASEDSLKEVKYEGIKIMVIGSSENRVLDEGFVGVYFEGQVVLNDQFHSATDSSYKEMYGVINAGILFPIGDDNQTQFMLEYTKVSNKDILTLSDGNYTGVTPGIRYVTENFNINLGVQIISREANAFTAESSERFVGNMSYRF